MGSILRKTDRGCRAQFVLASPEENSLREGLALRVSGPEPLRVCEAHRGVLLVGWGAEFSHSPRNRFQE